MSQVLTVQLSDRAFAAIQQRAQVAGCSPTEVAATSLEQQFAGVERTDLQKEEARERFRRHFGSVNLGHPIGSDNEQIDADLAAEYGSSHEDE